jgi:hypothetical protein
MADAIHLVFVIAFVAALLAMVTVLFTPRTELTGDARQARPAAALLVSFPTGRELWTPVPDLLDSPPFAQDFVAEVDNDGRALIRFGDGEYGREVAGATAFEAVYRTATGPPGTSGRVTARAAVRPGGLTDAVRPLPERAGAAERRRGSAPRPQAFRAEQFGAVTERTTRRRPAPGGGRRGGHLPVDGGLVHRARLDPAGPFRLIRSRRD